MKISLCALRLLSLITWLGGIIFFAFVLAPTVFAPFVVIRTHSFVLSGEIVAASLSKLHWIGLVCGAVFIVSSIVLALLRKAPLINPALPCALAAAMMLLTAYSQFSIIPHMESDRIAAGGDINSLPVTQPARAEFERLHPRSEHVEEAVLFCGLALTVLLARRQD
jgi:hypothetical protein